MSDEEMRLECLKLAIQRGSAEPIKLAANFADFVFGMNDSEVIAAAPALAEVVTPRA